MAKSSLWSWLPVLVWVIVISYLSFSPLDQYQIPKIIGLDKLVHFTLYGMLVGLLHLPVGINNKHFFFALLCVFAFSALTELIQHYFVPYRTGDVFDFIANLLGAISAFVLLKKLVKA